MNVPVANTFGTGSLNHAISDPGQLQRGKKRKKD
jgi:hypothetical protein